MVRVWYSYGFLQGDEAREVLDIIQDGGPDKALCYMMETMDALDSWPGGGEHMGTSFPWGKLDKLYETEGGWVLSWNMHLEYVGLSHSSLVDEYGDDMGVDMRAAQAPPRRGSYAMPEPPVVFSVPYTWGGGTISRRDAERAARAKGEDFWEAMIDLASKMGVQADYVGDI